MSDEVQVHYEDLYDAERDMMISRMDLGRARDSLEGDDVGIENPAQRPTLRLAMHRRFATLHDVLDGLNRDASGIWDLLSDISTQFIALDAELTGEEQS